MLYGRAPRTNKKILLPLFPFEYQVFNLSWHLFLKTSLRYSVFFVYVFEFIQLLNLFLNLETWNKLS